MITNAIQPASAGKVSHNRAHLAERRLSATIIDTVRLTGISRSELYRLLGEGKLRAYKAGSRTLLDWASVETYVSSLPPAAFRASNQAA
jgi:excisionase family DNA binding protein